MKIVSINVNNISISSPNKNVKFSGESNVHTSTDNNDNDKFVKVPKAQHDLENWIFGVLTGVTILQIIHILMKNKK